MLPSIRGSYLLLRIASMHPLPVPLPVPVAMHPLPVLPAGRGIQITALNFGPEPLEEVIVLDQVPPSFSLQLPVRYETAVALCLIVCGTITAT